MSTATNTTNNRRRITPIALAAAAVLALTPVMLMAQRGYGHGPHHGPGGGPGPMIERMFERLDLSADQEDAVHDALSRHREQTRTLVQEKIALRRALGETIHADIFDEGAVRQASADVAVVDADLAVMKARMFQEISKVLTSEQRERMRELIEDWHFMADEFRGRRSGPGPGPGSSE